MTITAWEESADSETGITDALQFRLPDGAPVFLCPACQCRLHYVGSRTNGEPASDLSDQYVCPAGCGAYEYARRSHRLRGTAR